jgi:hypothetical protein
MNAHTTTHTTVTRTSVSSTADRVVRPDTECRATASEFLTELIGSPPDALLWDDTHHLQGHTHFQGNELIVIAPRDDNHTTIVVTAQDWDTLRRATANDRRELLAACAIADHNRLMACVGNVNETASLLAHAA